MKLADRLGWLHVDDMLAEMEPAEMDERLAAKLIDGDQMERIAEILKLGFTAICQAWGAKLNPDNFEPRRIGVRAVAGGVEASSVPVASPNQAAALAAMALGKPNTRR